jgi:plasmid stabilization system protein ParE
LKLEWTPSALAELEAIAAWSWREHPDSSERLLTGLLNHIEMLAQFPFMGSAVKSQSPGTRRLLHTPFYMYYRVNRDAELIELLHIWHRSRIPPRM